MLLAKVASSLSGMEPAFQTQIKRQDEASDQTKALGYKVEHKLGVYFARAFDGNTVLLCPQVEGKELARRLEDEAAFGGRDRAAAGKTYTLNRRKRIAGATLAFGTYDPTHP